MEVLPIKLDVRDPNQVTLALGGLPESWHAIDILLNKAGFSRGLCRLQEGDVYGWEDMIDTNIKGLLYVAPTVLPGMIQRGRGHVINLGSIAGHEVYPNGNVYCATKHAVDVLTRGMRLDLLGTPIRVSSVDPGMVETEFSLVRFHGDQARAEKVYQGLRPLTAEDIADVILCCAKRPPHVNIQDIVIMPTDQASTTVVNRKQ